MLISAGTIREARSVVDHLHVRGVDFIKVHDSVPRDPYLEIARECKRLRVPFAGHVPPGVSAVEASHAGQRSIEHLGGNYEAVLLACSTHEARLGILARRMLQTSIQAAWRGTAPDETAPFRINFTKPIVEQFSSSKADALIKVFQQNGTWQTPTLVALENTWSSMRASLSNEELRIGEKLLQMDRDLVRRMKRAGVGILEGLIFRSTARSRGFPTSSLSSSAPG